MNPAGTQLAGLYVHVPFCSSVCPYCDFAVTIAGEERRQAWTAGVVAEAAMYSGLELEFDTLYLGGGTPSSLRPELLAEMVAGLRRHLDVSADAWLCLEVNPEDVTPANAAAWRELGFRFVSLGVQSLDDAQLAFLGRRHSAAEARDAIDGLLGADFETVSVDLIYGISGQDAASWRRQLEQVVGTGVPHLSCYQLTFHEGTLFGRRLARRELAEMGEAEQAELFYVTHRTLEELGRPAYEVSNFAAAPGHRSRHNQKYWDHTPYLGLGPSAHSLADGRRWWNQSRLRLWQTEVASGRLPVAGEEHPNVEQQVLEALMLRLRTTAGLDLELVRQRFGVDLRAANRTLLARLVADGYLRDEGQTVRPTLAGLAVADALAATFAVPDAAHQSAVE